MAKRFRSKFEAAIFAKAKQSGIKYESMKINYLVPERVTKYTPDFVLPNGIIIEAKGRFGAKDRKKHLLLKEQRPELDIRFMFQDANQTLLPRKTHPKSQTYSEWAEKNGFKWHEGEVVPEEWKNEAKK